MKRDNRAGESGSAAAGAVAGANPLGSGLGRQMAECSPVGMVVTNREGRTVYVNPRAAQLLDMAQARSPEGYDASRLKFTDSAGNAAGDFARLVGRVLEAGQPIHDIRYALVHPDGRKVLMSVSAAPLEAGGEVEGVLTAFEDVTDRARTEESRWAAEHRRAAILESISDAFVALDRHWRYTYVNRRAGELFGRRPEELVGKHIWTEFPEGVGQKFYHAYHRALSEGVMVRIEEYYPPWDRWYENRIYPGENGLAIYFTDITERRKSEQLLAGQIRVLEMVASGGPLAETLDALVRVIDEQDPSTMGSILLMDPDGVHVRHGAAPRLPEAYVRAVDGQPIGERAGSCGTAAYRGEAVVVEDITTDPLWQDYRELAAAHGLRACWSTPILGEDRRVLGTFAMYRREPGGPTANHLSLIDMATQAAAIAISSGHKRLALVASEGRYRALAAELEKRVAERTTELEARNLEMEAFTYSVSHDLKAPLRGLDGYSRLLLDDHSGRLDKEGRTFLGNIRAATVQMGKLIDDLLAYSRMERRPLESGRVELEALVEGLLAERHREVLGRSADIEVDLRGAVVTADREGLTVAIRNLLDNACKFTAGVPRAVIEIGGRATDSGFTLWVKDNGPGFDMRFHDRIFEIFQRLHRSEDHPGTGIGLAIVRRAMERMGGRAYARSEPGQGATFYLEIPS